MRKIMFGTHVLVDLDELADKYTKEEIDNMISTVFVYKGTVATTGDLDSIEDPKVGDCWNVEADGNNYAWNGSEWDKLGGTVDLSDYYTKTQVDAIKSALELQIQAVESLPTGGTEGQVLTKNSSTDGDASWKSFNSLVFKEHLDTPDDLPNLGQPSGVMGSKAYNFTYNFEVFSSRVSKKITNVSALEAITKAKGKYKYYVAGLAYETRAYVIGTNYPETVVIDYQGRPSIQATSEKPAEGFSFYTTMGIIEKTTNILIEDGFATNIPSIGIDPNYDTYYVERDDGSIYNYNVGMTLVGTSGESSYVVTDEIPEDLKAYNFYTVGNNNDMYVFNGNTFDVFSKSGVPSGGTTGQVLSKNSDADGDTSWKSLPNSLSIKGHIDSENELPVITQGSGIVNSYNTTIDIDTINNNLNSRSIEIPENLKTTLETFKTQYKYYLIYYYNNSDEAVALFTNKYNVIGISNMTDFIGIEDDEDSKVVYFSGGFITSNASIKKNTIYMDLINSNSYFETNIPNITAYDRTYDSFSYQSRSNNTNLDYYYNRGMPVISTFNGTSYLVTNKVPDIQFNYNEIYTVGDYNDLYVIDESSSNWVCYSKSRIPKGGVKGQVLSKTGDEDYETAWKDVESGGIPTFIGTEEQPINALDYDMNINNRVMIWKGHINNFISDSIIGNLKSNPEMSILVRVDYDREANPSNSNTFRIIQYTYLGYVSLWGDSRTAIYSYTRTLTVDKEAKTVRGGVWRNVPLNLDASANYKVNLSGAVLTQNGANNLYTEVSEAVGYTGTSGSRKLVPLTELQTTDKTSLISAINEVHNSNVVTSLWTNSSPTSSLAPGNITLSSSTDDYDSIEFIFTDYMETNNYLSVTVPKGKNVNLSCNLYFANLMHYCSRVITYVNATTYDVKDGYNTSNTDPSSPVLHNDCCILQEIRGHKVIKSS